MTAAVAVADARATAVTTGSPYVYLSAGEPSGDEYAADLLQAMIRIRPGLRCAGMGGTGLERAGGQLHTHMERLTAMGLAELVTRLPAHVRALGAARTTLADHRPDVSVLIDYPGFHARVARVLKAYGVPVIQFVAPKFWAWHPSRSRAYRGLIDHFAAIFPFETDFLETLGLPATFVGHPVMDIDVPTRAEARARLDVPADSRVLAVFPGSRPQEIKRMWRMFRDAAHQVRAALPDVRIVVAGRRGQKYPDGNGIHISRDDSRTVMAAADVLIGKSGTSNLLAARLGVPMVIAHTVHPVTYAAARRLVRTPFISPVNVVAGRRVVPELIQGQATARAVATEIVRVLETRGARAGQVQRFDEIVSSLGPFRAVDRVAEMAIERCALT